MAGGAAQQVTDRIGATPPCAGSRHLFEVYKICGAPTPHTECALRVLRVRTFEFGRS